MKSFIDRIPLILITIIIIIISFHLYNYFTSKPIIIPPDETKIKLLKKQIEINTEQINSLKFQRDSLLTANKKIKTRIIYLTAEIDSSISKDSSNAIPEYRQALTLFNYLPAAADILTLREIGLGAKIITEAYGMTLRIKNYESALNIEEEINNKFKEQISLKDSTIGIKNSSIKFWENKYKETQSFWFDRFIFYAGIGINYNGTNVEPGIQFGIGIRLTTIKF